MRCKIRFKKMENIKIFVMPFFILLIMIALQTGASAAAAPATAQPPAPGVAEAPNVRVVINGVPGSYTDSALEINDRVLLPFRELLTKLGVSNDDDHIIWNDNEESVTVINNGNTIWLQIGNPVMIVNDVEKVFDVAPYFYSKNNRTYIPVRAVSELLDKKIMWEEDTTTVYIRDNDNYQATLDLLEMMQDASIPTKVHAFSDSLINFRLTTNVDPLPGAGDDGVLRATVKMQQELSSDTASNTTHVKQVTDFDGTKIATEVFTYENRTFARIESTDSDWYDATEMGGVAGFSVDQIMFLNEQMNVRPLADIAMGLAATRGSDGSFTLVGEPLAGSDVNLILGTINELIQQQNLTVSDIKFDKFQIGVTIDADYNPTKAVVSVTMDFSFIEKTAGNNDVAVYFSADMYVSITYDNVGARYTVPVPDGVKALL